MTKNPDSKGGRGLDGGSFLRDILGTGKTGFQLTAKEARILRSKGKIVYSGIPLYAPEIGQVSKVGDVVTISVVRGNKTKNEMTARIESFAKDPAELSPNEFTDITLVLVSDEVN